MTDSSDEMPENLDEITDNSVEITSRINRLHFLVIRQRFAVLLLSMSGGIFYGSDHVPPDLPASLHSVQLPNTSQTRPFVELADAELHCYKHCNRMLTLYNFELFCYFYLLSLECFKHHNHMLILYKFELS